MLDINEFRVDKGGNPERIRESQRRRHANVALVDEVIELDQQWVKRASIPLIWCIVLFCSPVRRGPAQS